MKEYLKTITPNTCITNTMNCLFNTKYNKSLVVMTLALYYVLSMFSYSSNMNFDMYLTVNNNIKIFSMLAILIGFFKNTEESRVLINIGITSFLLSFISIIMSKTFMPLSSEINFFILAPLNIFVFFLLIKTMLEVGGVKQVSKK